MPFNRACSLPLLLIVGVVAILGQLMTAPTIAIANSPANTPTDVTCGMIITVPGTYIISGTLNCSATGDGIHINTSNVTIQFNHGSLTCGGCPTSGGTETAIKVYDPAGGPISNVRILGPGTIESYPFGVSFAGVKDSQISAMSLIYGGLHISLNDDTNGDHCQHDLFTSNGSYSAFTGDIVGAIYDSTFIGNNLAGTISGGIGVGIQILNGNKNRLIGNSAAQFLVGIELGGVGSTGARDNILTGNRVSGNSTGLLVMPPADHNRFKVNYIYSNSTLDINEGNASCGTDVWTKNIFATTNQGCV